MNRRLFAKVTAIPTEFPDRITLVCRPVEESGDPSPIQYRLDPLHWRDILERFQFRDGDLRRIQAGLLAGQSMNLGYQTVELAVEPGTENDAPQSE